MPETAAEEVRRWSGRARVALRRRDDAVVRMRADGATLREIAAAAELSHTAIAKILDRQNQPPPR